MANRWTLRGSRGNGLSARLSPHVRLAGLTLVAAAPLLLAAALVPRTVVLPTLTLAAIAAAGLAALAAWSLGARRHAKTITLWDIAGAFALIGCAAAMLSEPENVLQTLGHR